MVQGLVGGKYNINAKVPSTDKDLFLYVSLSLKLLWGILNGYSIVS